MEALSLFVLTGFLEFHLRRQIQVKVDENPLRVWFWLVAEAQTAFREEDRTGQPYSYLLKESKGRGLSLSLYPSRSIDRSSEEEEQVVAERSFGDPEVGGGGVCQ